MPELRKDPVVGRWVIIATDRSARPTDFRMVGDRERRKPRGGFCPFCEGHEDKTPPEIQAYRHSDSQPNGRGWWIRVVPNKFPALQVEGELEKRGDGIYDRMNGVGAHEVIIESPEHVVSLCELDVGRVGEVLWVYKERLLDLKQDRRLKYGMIFKNVGEEAGASLEHSHSQLIATPVVPRNVMAEMNGTREFFDYRGRCLYCDMIRQELSSGERIAMDGDDYVALMPFAPRFPFEVWLLPKAHGSHFEEQLESSQSELAGMLHGVLCRLEKALNYPAYNYMIHTAPFDGDGGEHYHWHIEITPRLTSVAGFEWGTGFYINPVAPESAAEFLRQTGV